MGPTIYPRVALKAGTSYNQSGAAWRITRQSTLLIYDAFVRADAIEVAAGEGEGKSSREAIMISRRTNPVIETHLVDFR